MERNVSIHISDRSHLNLTLNVYNCGNQDITIDKELKGDIKNGGNKEAAKAVGEVVAKRALEKGIKEVCFDRGGYLYHGRVKELADGAREAGLKF